MFISFFQKNVLNPDKLAVLPNNPSCSICVYSNGGQIAELLINLRILIHGFLFYKCSRKMQVPPDFSKSTPLGWNGKHQLCDPSISLCVKLKQKSVSPCIPSHSVGFFFSFPECIIVRAKCIKLEEFFSDTYWSWMTRNSRKALPSFLHFFSPQRSVSLSTSKGNSAVQWGVNRGTRRKTGSWW